MSENLSEEQSSIKTIENIEKQLVEADPKVFDGVNKQKKNQIIRTVAVQLHKTHSGPLPDIETLTGYSELIPNGADRIMKMAENQSAHRIKLENKVISSQIIQSYLGQVFAFILSLFVFSIGGFLIYQNHEIAGSLFGIGGLTGLVTVFIKGKSYQKENLEGKSHSKQ